MHNTDLFIFGTVSAMLLFPWGVVCLFVILRGEWQTGIRLFLLISLPILAFVIVLYLLKITLPPTVWQWLPKGLTLFCLTLSGLCAAQYLFNRLRAGELLLKEHQDKHQLWALAGAVLFICWDMMVILNPGMTQRYWIALPAWAACWIIAATNTFEVRSNGILNNRAFLWWGVIASITWANNLRKDSLQVTLSNSPKVRKITVPFEQREAVDAFLKSRFAPSNRQSNLAQRAG